MARKDIDHRTLAERLDLLHFEAQAPGMAFFHPRGLVLYRLLEDAVRSVQREHGYAEVRTPQVLRQAVWEKSGHHEHFREHMFRMDDQRVPAALKPVSCPGHIAIAGHRPRSYRELPLRLCELGVVHRDEPSGTLHGLLRLRQFTQDDGHVFCAPEQVEAELARFCALVGPFYAAFGFEEVSFSLATRPAQSAGDDASWAAAEAALALALERSQIEYRAEPGGGAFYGPKLEVALRDRRGRSWQCGTIQLDVAMPERFGLRYVDASGERRRPCMLHRALYGSLERFLGIVLEQHGAVLPPWLAPQQIAVLPVTCDDEPYAWHVADALAACGLRVDIDARGESLGRRIAEAHVLALPAVLVVGARERERQAVALRHGGRSSSLPLSQAIALLLELCRAPDFASLARAAELR